MHITEIRSKDRPTFGDHKHILFFPALLLIAWAVNEINTKTAIQHAVTQSAAEATLAEFGSEGIVVTVKGVFEVSVRNDKDKVISVKTNRARPKSGERWSLKATNGGVMLRKKIE